MVVPGFFCSFCGKNAHVSNPYLVARCPYGSAHSRECYSSRYFAENGRVWFFKVFFSHVSPCRKSTFYSTACFICHGNYIRCLCHFDAEGHEEIDRLF